MVQEKDTSSVLRKTQEMLSAATRGLNDLVGSKPEVRSVGIYNLAEFGRSVTLVLQNLRAIDKQSFDIWYAPYKQEMAAEPLFAYFRNLRNEILKEGAPPTSMSMRLGYLDGRMMAELQKDPPSGARGFFIGGDLPPENCTSCKLTVLRVVEGGRDAHEQVYGRTDRGSAQGA